MLGFASHHSAESDAAPSFLAKGKENFLALRSLSDIELQSMLNAVLKGPA